MTKQPPPPPPRRPSGFQPEPSNREKMADAVKALVTHVAEQKAEQKAEVQHERERRKKKQRRRLAEVGVLVVVFAVSLVLAIPRWKTPFATPAGAEAAAHARRTLVFAASLVAQYEARTGRAPGALTQVGVALPGVAYQRVADRWTLSMKVEGRDIVFQKGDDPARFLSSP